MISQLFNSNELKHGWLSSHQASTDRQVALISLGADGAGGVVGKTCIGVPTRLIYSLKSWIDKSFIKKFK